MNNIKTVFRMLTVLKTLLIICHNQEPIREGMTSMECLILYCRRLGKHR